MSRPSFCQCSCFFSHNIFIRKYNTHFTYSSRLQFLRDYNNILESVGCVSEVDQDALIEQIEQEVVRRKGLAKASQARRLLVTKEYTPLHADIYSLKEEHFTDEFLRLVTKAKSGECGEEDLVAVGMTPHRNRIYSFPIFTKEFCQKLLEEVKHFEESPLPKERPNTMNKYGVLLREMGFDEGFLDALRERYLVPLCSVLYPECGGGTLDSHWAFIVTYQTSTDKDLSFHYDNAEVTLNVSLNGDFTDGSLYFGDMRDVALSETTCCEYRHRPYYGVLHRGQHRHGALPITSGQRYNLIMWMRSSTARNALCPRCDRSPQLVPVQDGYGDGFTTSNRACVSF